MCLYAERQNWRNWIFFLLFDFMGVSFTQVTLDEHYSLLLFGLQCLLVHPLMLYRSESVWASIEYIIWYDIHICIVSHKKLLGDGMCGMCFSLVSHVQRNSNFLYMCNFFFFYQLCKEKLKTNISLKMLSGENSSEYCVSLCNGQF